MLRRLTDAVLHHIDLHSLGVTDINSLSADGELAQIAAKTTVNQMCPCLTSQLNQRLKYQNVNSSNVSTCNNACMPSTY